jgi:Cu(I)/Ag(I) efflux system membrane fusion protein/cobalt-zinc-cadmium efflux system membrane fusion protein
MHPDVHESHPGTCPICGMTLERKSAAASNEAHGEAHESRAETANPPRPGITPLPVGEIADPRTPVEIDSRRQQLAGVRIAQAERAALSRSIRATGVVRFDESRWTDVTLRLEGYVRDLYVDRTGQPVRRGQPLFTVYSPDVATAIAEYRLAVRAQASLPASASEVARDQSARLVDAARLRLARWDVSGDQVDGPEPAGEPRTTFRSPVSGIVMEKTIVRGMRALPGDVLYKIVDPSNVWIEASVHEPDLGAVAIGQHGTIRMDAFPDETFAGRITYVAPALDADSRTAAVRLELANRSGRLKAGMFATVDLSVPLGRGLVVPADAVLDSGSRQLVFVSEGDGYFVPRPVVVGHRVEGRVEILSGLAEGDKVAEGAAFFIDSESQLRAATQGYAQTKPAASQGAASSRKLAIDLSVSPEPLKTGPATLIVTVTGSDGQPVTGAAVTVVFAMPAMPTMNMPAMRAEALLGPVDAAYRGTIAVPMAGRWDVTITVTRGQERLGSRQVTVIAR